MYHFNLDVAIVGKIYHLLKQSLLANNCFVCGQTSTPSVAICHYCQALLPRVNDISSCVSNNISVNNPAWDHAYAFYEYKDSVQLLVKAFKFNHNFLAGKILQHLFYQCIKNEIEMKQYDVIIPMPIHTRRNLRRGFNQSIYLAKYISKMCHIPVDLNYTKRVKNTHYQNKLSLVQRKENIKQAFNVISAKNYKSVLVIDDIITTGFSLHELSNELKQSGIKNVCVCCLSMRLKTN